jgi:uncharacterized protein (DUF2141 family)
MKRIIFCLWFLIFALYVFPQTNDIKVIVEIHNVIKNTGTLHVSVSLNESAYRNQTPNIIYQFEPVNTVMQVELTIPEGECVINIYQDINRNGICDTGLFGIPKEPVGITNWNGRGPPGNFNRLKMSINNTTQIIRINLYQL